MCKHEPYDGVSIGTPDDVECVKEQGVLVERKRLPVMILDEGNMFPDKHEVMWRMHNGIS